MKDIRERVKQVTGKGDNLSEITIGDVTGGIHTTVIAGRDVQDVTISLGGQPTPAEKEDLKVDDLKQLLAEIQTQLADLAAEQEALQAVSVAAPFTAQGAEAGINEAAVQIEGEVDKEQAQSIQHSLNEATSLLTGILDGAKSVAEKAGEVGQAVKPIAEQLAPLVERLGVAALWVGKLWLT